MAGFGTTAIFIVLAIAALVAIPGLLASRGGTIGRIFHDFSKTPAVPDQSPITAPASYGRFCTACSAPQGAADAFCTQCGSRL